MIIRRNELKSSSPVGIIQQNGDSQTRKSAIKNNSEKTVAFQKDEPEKREKNSEKLLMISYEKVKRHKQR